MKKIIKNFFIDKLVYIVFMIVNSLLLTTFYTFTIGETVEVMYPLIITIFLISTLLVIDFFRYSFFNKSIERLQKDNNHMIKGSTREQKEVIKAIKNINLTYAEKEQRILTDYEEKIYFLVVRYISFKIIYQLLVL